MEQVMAWLTEHGVAAVLVAWAIAVWAQLKPQVWVLMRSLIGLVQQQQLREVLLALVRAAEQMYGPQSDAGNAEAAKALGERKLGYVLDQAADKGLRVTIPDVEAAVHEVKTGLPKLIEALAIDDASMRFGGADDPSGV